MTQQRTSRKPDGHPGPNGRLNSHGPAYAPAHPAGGERGGALGPACTDRLRGQAAADDAGRDPVALAAAAAATNLHTQADTDCQAYAAAATPLPNEVATARGSRGNPAGEGNKNVKEINGVKEKMITVARFFPSFASFTSFTSDSRKKWQTQN